MSQILLLFLSLSSLTLASTNFENFFKNSIFSYQKQRNNFIYTLNGPKHGLSLQQVEDSLPNEFIGAVEDPAGVATFRHCFALKPAENRAILVSYIFITCVDVVNSVKNEAKLTVSDRTRMLSNIRFAGLFSNDAQLDENSLAALNHFYCRRALGLVAPVLEAKEIEWLKRVHPESLATNHELLDGLQNFAKFPSEMITRAARNFYDFTLNQNAIKTVSVDGWAAFLLGRNYNLSPAEIARLSKANNFAKLLASNLNAWQVFYMSPVYFSKFKSLRGLYEKLLKKDLKKAPLIAFYFYLQNSIGSALFTAATAARGTRPSDLPFSGEEHLTHLKDLLNLNVEVVANLKALAMTEMAKLYSTPVSWILRAALSSFDENAKVEGFDSLFELIPQGLAESVTDQITDYRTILECLGSDYWPVVNEGYIYPTDMIQLVSSALASDVSNSPMAIKAFVLAQINEAVMFFAEEELEATIAASLSLLKALPAEIFNEADSEFLKQFSALEEVTDMIKEFSWNQECFVILSEVEVECRVSAKVRAFEGNVDALIEHALGDQIFLKGLSRVGHVFNLNTIEMILKSEKGIRLLSENIPLLHSLRTYENFTSEHLDQLKDSFDVERLGVGLNTFPLSLLIRCLCLRQFELNDPTAFLSRFDYSWWLVPEFRPLLANALNINSISQWLDHFLDDPFKISYGVGFVIHRTYSLEERLIEYLWWHVRQQVRILDFLVFFNLHYVPEIKGPLFAKTIAFHRFTGGLNDQTDQYLCKNLISECMSLTKEPKKLLLVKKVLFLIKTPLCEVIAGRLLIVNGKTEVKAEVAESAFPIFKQLYSGWLTRSTISGDYDKVAVDVHEDMKVQRQSVLDLLKDLNCPAFKIAAFEARFKMLSLVAMRFDRLNAPVRVKEVVQLMRGELPLWEAKIVARLLMACDFPVAELESVREEDAFLVDEIGIVINKE